MKPETNTTEAEKPTSHPPAGQICGAAHCSGGPLSAEMIREMEAHIPTDVKSVGERWEWCAEYLNETLNNPMALCECCNVTREGEVMDHLPGPFQPNTQGHQGEA